MSFFKNTDKAMEAMEEQEVAQEAVENTEEEKVIPIEQAAAKKKRMPWAIWEVGGREFKLKLNTPEILELEKKYKTNLMNIMGSGEGGMPALTVMLDITHAAMKAFEHGITKQNVIELFGKYEAEGGSQLEFYTKVYMNIFAVSGFFSNSLTEQMQDALENTAEIM